MASKPFQHPSGDVVKANGSHDQRVIGGRYRVLRRLKSGQDAKAFVATDLSVGKSVVVKTAQASSFSASVRMRLEHEAQVLSQFGNGVFAPLLDYGSDGDQAFLVMPFVPGITLQQRLRQGPLPVMDAISVGRAILTALSAVHAHDVQHRDVKPAT